MLLLGERIDEWVMGQIEEFEGKRFKDAARGDLELGALASEADKQAAGRGQLKESKGLLKRVKDALGERVTRGARQHAPARIRRPCLVLGEHDLGASMRRMLRGRRARRRRSRSPALELNVGHPLVKYLDGVSRRRAVHRAGAAALRPGRAGRGRPARAIPPSTCSA